ncbi:MAG: hypothetical protein FP824_06085, partial [Euryarchaeota archaeon]|nr:hypothetical protein [Euryarchaeota archaeon]
MVSKGGRTMESKILTSIIALGLAFLMAVPIGIVVSGSQPDIDAGVLNAPGNNYKQNAMVSISDYIYNVWIDGPQHNTRLMFSMSLDSGNQWTQPEVVTGSDFTPMDVKMVAGASNLHIIWMDGTSRMLSTGYLAINFDGQASHPMMFKGENPSIDSEGSQVAIATSAKGELNLYLSQNEGQDFQSQEIFPGLITTVSSLSFDNGLGIVACAGVRDPNNGKISDRGIYHAFYDGSWSIAKKIVDTGTVKELTLNSDGITWTEESSISIDQFEMKVLAPGIFGEKKLISSEEVTNQPAPTALAPSRLPPKKWTYICYLDADNNLDSFGYEDANEMEMIGSDADVNIVVLFDGMNNGDSKAWYIEQDAIPATITSPEIALTDINPGWGTELNMGDPQTAIDWVNYVYANYPADRYMWDMWNHGGSWNWGMCSDDTNGGDNLASLEVREIYETLRIDNNKLKLFDVAGYDECLMSDVSTDYDEIPYIDYICNSEDSIAGDGWEYNLVLGPLAANPDMGGEEAAWLIFDAYGDFYGTSGSLTTMSIINSTMFFLELIPAINTLAQKGIHDITANRALLQTASNNAADWQGYSHQKDLLDFCYNIVATLPANEIRQAAQEVITAGTACPPGTQFGAPAWDGERAIIIHNQNSGEYGITIYANDPPYDNLYDTMTFTESNWDEFYKVLWGSDASNPNTEPGVVITSPSDGGTVTIDSIVTITGTASDTDGSVQGVEVAIDTEHWEPAAGTTAWSFGWDTTGRALGFHWIQARSYDGQDYSDPYLIQVNMVDVTSEGTVDIQLPKYPMEASVKVTVKDTDLNTGPGVQTTTINVDSGAEPAGENLLLTETGGDTGVFEGFLTISGTNGAGILWVNAADTITATYNDADYGGAGPLTLQDTAIIDGTPPGPPAGLTVEWYGLVQASIFTENFEGDGTPTLGELGWTTGGASTDWQVADPAGLGTPPDPSSAYAGAYCIGNDLTGLGTYPGEYEDSIAVDSNYIYSPAINCVGFSSVQLQFMRYLGVESPSYDHSNIEASRNPAGPWTQIWTNGATISDTSWSSVSYDISAVADNQPAVYVRFELGQTDGSVTYCGWNIDNLELVGMTSGTMHNTVNWTLSPDDGAGANDVVAYNIYRANNEFGPWSIAAQIDTLGSGAVTYTDPDRGEYDGTNWWYVVRAEDDLGNEDSNTNAIPEIPTSNIAPSIPNNPTPANGAIGVSVDPTLSVRVADPNGDLLTVRFYDAAGPTLIGTNPNVPSGTFTNTPWSGLSPTTTYTWYVTADDGEFVTQSPTWSFTTVDMTPPGPPADLTVDWWGGGFQVLYNEGFEGDGTPTLGELGWITGGASTDWQVATPTGLGGEHGNPDP